MVYLAICTPLAIWFNHRLKTRKGGLETAPRELLTCSAAAAFKRLDAIRITAQINF